MFQVIFNPLIIKYDGVYSIKSTSFIQTLFERMKSSLNITTANNSDFVIPYHEALALSLESTENCIRKLEELTYHLFAAKSYFKLK